MTRLHYREMPTWPPLAWLAVCESGGDAVRVFHGPRVETRPDWFCEAVWDGPFEAGGFDRNERVFGSGGRLREGRLRFVSCGAPFDRLHHVERAGRTWVSNSLACLSASAGLPLDPTWPHYPKDFMSIKRGVRRAVRELVTAAEPIGLVYDDDLLWTGAAVERAPKAFEPAELGSFHAYRKFLDGSLAGLLANARDPARRHRYEPILALSSGMDSGACAALAAAHGLREAVTFRHARRGLADSGAGLARVLGLDLHAFERDAWRRLPLAEVPFFLGDARGPDVFYRPAEPLLAGRLLLTGYVGGGLWNPTRRFDHVDQGRNDSSGVSLAEFRLWCGALHLPVPVLGYRQAAEIRALATSAEMAPWRVPGLYDKPVARRILLEAGVPEAALARDSRATTVLWRGETTFLSPGSRADFEAWLRRNEGRLAPAHGGSPLADLPRGGLAVRVGRAMTRRMRLHSSPRRRRLREVARWLVRRDDPTPLMRYFLPWAMDHGWQRYERPDDL